MTGKLSVIYPLLGKLMGKNSMTTVKLTQKRISLSIPPPRGTAQVK